MPLDENRDTAEQIEELLEQSPELLREYLTELTEEYGDYGDSVEFKGKLEAIAIALGVV